MGHTPNTVRRLRRQRLETCSMFFFSLRFSAECHLKKRFIRLWRWKSKLETIGRTYNWIKFNSIDKVLARNFFFSSSHHVYVKRVIVISNVFFLSPCLISFNGTSSSDGFFPCWLFFATLIYQNVLINRVFKWILNALIDRNCIQMVLFDANTRSPWMILTVQMFNWNWLCVGPDCHLRW